MRSASSRPGSPVAALALPLLSTTADARPPLASRCRLLTCTGAAVARLAVKTAAAGTGWPSAVATTARSGTPSALIPQCTPPATNPPGAVTLIGSPSATPLSEARAAVWSCTPPLRSGARSLGVHGRLGQPRRLVEPEHEIGPLN